MPPLDPETTSGGPTGPALHRLLEQSAGLLRAVKGGASLSDALNGVPPALRPGAQSLAFHVMRWRAAGEAALATLAPRKPAPEVEALLVTALCLLWPTGAATAPYADHTLVNEAVKAVRRSHPSAGGFVNAVLRAFLRQRDGLVHAVARDEVARWNHPAWWIRRLKRDWPAQAEGILTAAQQHPPLTLRAHARRGGVAALGPALTAAGLAWQAAGPLTPQGVHLLRPVPVDRIPGFPQGDWSVQDVSAQRAAPLLLDGLEAAAGAQALPRVLDACAAPGGKTAHLLELRDLDLTALDSDARRLERVAQTLMRLGLDGGVTVNAGSAGDEAKGGRAAGSVSADGPATRSRVRLQAADARAVHTWWDGALFDAILLDAPCTGSGIVRRHPDARWLRRDSDVAALARTQAELLDALWPLLRPGGRLLYATCSVFRDEGSRQVDAFLQRQTPGSVQLDPRSPGHILPLVDNEEHGTAATPAPDGFFYALLHKR